MKLDLLELLCWIGYITWFHPYKSPWYYCNSYKYYFWLLFKPSLQFVYCSVYVVIPFFRLKYYSETPFLYGGLSRFCPNSLVSGCLLNPFLVVLYEYPIYLFYYLYSYLVVLSFFFSSEYYHFKQETFLIILTGRRPFWLELFFSFLRLLLFFHLCSIKIVLYCFSYTFRYRLIQTYGSTELI